MVSIFTVTDHAAIAVEKAILSYFFKNNEIITILPCTSVYQHISTSTHQYISTSVHQYIST